MPLQATSGAASYDAFGGGVAAVPKYIEDYFSTYLVTGDGTAPAVNNGIDLSTKGGLVWIKKRSAAGSHSLFDTARGANLRLISNDTAAQDSVNLSFTTTGFSNYTLDSGVTYASWSWAKAPKFFDVVTWSGNDTGGRRISHNLGSVPGCIIVKAFNAGSTSWVVYHRSLGGVNKVIVLNSTNAVVTATGFWGTSDPTSTDFGVSDGSFVNNASGQDYVAYLFAHDAGGFGLTGSDNVISCGSYTGNGSSTGPEVNIGYEPQWLLIKEATQSGNSWSLYDNMRGLSVAGPSGHLRPNDSAAEDTTTIDMRPTATGFQPISSSGRVNRSGETFIYIAIRRGPMKVPTSGTSVFSPVARTGTGANATVSGVGFPPDLFIGQIRGTAGYWNGAVDRLRGVTKRLVTSQTNAEDTTTDAVTSFTMDGSTLGIDSNGFVNESGKTYIEWNFRRAPSFFDEVCYTGTGSATQNYTHNLNVIPEMMLLKCRSNAATYFFVYHSALGVTGGYPNYLALSETSAQGSGNSTFWAGVPTSTYFSVGNYADLGASGRTYVAYLFATCAGVSKVGSYTGTGTTLQVDCGFTAGARFVLIKRTDSNGDWYVWDSARGIVAGNDPYLLLNSTAAEVTNTDYVDTYSAGFEISSTAPSAINANGGSFIFFAVS